MPSLLCQSPWRQAPTSQTAAAFHSCLNSDETKPNRPHVLVLPSVGNSDQGPRDRRLWLQRVRRLPGERSLRQHDQTWRASRPSWAQTLRQDPAGDKGIHFMFEDNSVEFEALLHIVQNNSGVFLTGKVSHLSNCLIFWRPDWWQVKMAAVKADHHQLQYFV